MRFQKENTSVSLKNSRVGSKISSFSAHFLAFPGFWNDDADIPVDTDSDDNGRSAPRGLSADMCGRFFRLMACDGSRGPNACDFDGFSKQISLGLPD